jgi:hypothetical protein
MKFKHSVVLVADSVIVACEGDGPGEDNPVLGISLQALVHNFLSSQPSEQEARTLAETLEACAATLRQSRTPPLQ